MNYKTILTTFIAHFTKPRLETNDLYFLMEMFKLFIIIKGKQIVTDKPGTNLLPHRPHII